MATELVRRPGDCPIKLVQINAFSGKGIYKKMAVKKVDGEEDKNCSCFSVTQTFGYYILLPLLTCRERMGWNLSTRTQMSEREEITTGSQPFPGGHRVPGRSERVITDKLFAADLRVGDSMVCVGWCVHTRGRECVMGSYCAVNANQFVVTFFPP